MRRQTLLTCPSLPGICSSAVRSKSELSFWLNTFNLSVHFSFRVIEWIKHGFEKVVPHSPAHLRPPAGTATTAQKAASAPVTPCKQEPGNFFFLIKVRRSC